MARVKQSEHDMIYRMYVTDSLRSINGSNIRYYDLITEVPVETRTAKEIIDHIRDKINSLE